MKQQRWTRDQLLKVLTLYCQLPFGKMHSRNPAVVALAEVIDRTPSAVALKLVNFASLDPELRGRGVGGMENSSSADRAIWAEFYGRWDVLADHAVSGGLNHAATRTQSPPTPHSAAPTGPTEVVRATAQRRGQAFFRAAVLAAHNGTCCITGITSPALLRASHIVPWSHDPERRLDPRNGLCLNALHDAAFDRGLITLTDRHELQISTRVKDEVPATIYEEMFRSRAGSPITMPERFRPLPESLEYHRREVFVA